MKGISKVALVGVAILALALAVAACGGSGSATTAAPSSGTAGEGGDGQGGGSVAAASEVVAPYIGHPSPFPVTEKLREVPTGAKIIYAECSSPICALFWQLLTPAAQTMGVDLERIKAGSAASTVDAAFDTIVTKHPDGVIVPAINIELWNRQLKELQESDIPVVTTGVIGAEDYGIPSPQSAENYAVLVGKLMANYVVAKMNPQAEVAMYDVPELPFTPILAETFTAELESICSECSARIVHVPVATLGNTAPNTIVSDLQANPDTDVAVFATDTIQAGLPSALKAAGIDIETLGDLPAPDNLQYLKEGKETAALGYDLPVSTWTLLDQLAREITGQKLTGPEAEGIPDLQFLRQEDITFDPEQGWTGYPDFAERFAKLWGVGG